MADELAVLDAPEVEEAELEAVDRVDEAPAVEAVEEKRDGRVEPQWLRDLKSSNNPGYKDAKEKFFALRDLDGKLKDFDLDGTKAFLEEYGGRDNILTTLQEREAKAQELDSINDAIERGDTSILERIPQESVASLAPAMMGKWAETDPDGYSAAVFGALAQAVNQTQTQSLYKDENGNTPSMSVPTLLAEARSALRFAPPEQQGAIANALLNRFEQFVNGFAQKATAPPVKTEQKVQGKQGETVESVKTQAFNQKYSSDMATTRANLQKTAMQSHFDPKNPNSTKERLAMRELHEQVQARMDADTALTKNLDNLLMQGQKRGSTKEFFDLYNSRYTKIAKDIAPSVAKELGFVAATAPKPAPVARREPVARPTIKSGDKFDAIWDRARA